MKRLVRLLVALGLFSLSACGERGPNPVVVIDTSEGPIRAELYQDKAPITVKNFLTYVDEKFYDGTIFHRVIPDFMIQSGGFTADGKEKKTHEPIKNESYNNLPNKRGTLAMARTSVPDSASAQFFINLKDNAFLDRANAQDGVGYAVFGKVTDETSMDVVFKIADVKTHTVFGPGGPMKDVPEETVLIKSIRRVEPKADGK